MVDEARQILLPVLRSCRQVWPPRWLGRETGWPADRSIGPVGLRRLGHPENRLSTDRDKSGANLSCAIEPVRVRRL